MTQGIFDNQGMGELPTQGVFQNQVAASGFGSTGGIFTGPTALGIALTGLGNEECEIYCKEEATPDFMARCLADCAKRDALTEETGEPQDFGYGERITGQPMDVGEGERITGQPCSSSDVIQMVQMAVGASIDGKWGPNSQAALMASGKPYRAFVPDCIGAVPYSNGGASNTGGGGILTPGTTPGTIPSGGPPPAAQAGMLDGFVEFMKSEKWGLPVAGWAAGFTVLTAITIAIIRIQMKKAG